MPRRLPRAARLSLTGVKLAVLGTLVVAGLVTRPEAPAGPGYAGYPIEDLAADAVTGVLAPPSARLQRVLDRHDCSPTGFADATPTSAVIRTARGRLQHVSFDTGWEVFTAHGPDQLVAVCLAPPPADSFTA